MRNISLLLVVCAAVAMMGGCGFHPASNLDRSTTAASLTVTATASSARLGDAAVQFSASTEYGAASSCTWAVNGTTGGSATLGTIDATGKYTAPAVGAVTLQNPTTVSITASANGVTSAPVTLSLLNPAPAVTGTTGTPLVGVASAIQVTGTNFVQGAQVLFGGTAVTATVSSPTQLTATVTATAEGNVSVSVKNPDPGTTTSGTVTMAAVNPVVISGEADKGPLQGAKIEVWAMNAGTGADVANGLLGSSTTNNLGQFSVTLKSLPAAGTPLRLKALPPGTYVDDTDTTQTVAYGIEMDTLIDDGSHSVSGLAITPVTDMINAATVAALNAPAQGKANGANFGGVSAAHASALATIKGHWGFTSNPEQTPAKTDAASVTSDPDGFRMGVLNGSMLTCAYNALGKSSGVDPAAFIKALGIDIGDGVFDGMYLNNGTKKAVTIPGTNVPLSASAGTSDFLNCMNQYVSNPNAAIAGAVTASGALITSLTGSILTSIYGSPATPPNPAPTIKLLSPSSAVAGTAGFTLTITGSGFLASSVVRWNGTSKTTTYVNGNELRAVVAAADISAAGSASVTVFNPLPGGGTSSASTFAVSAPPAPLAVTSIFPTYQIAGAPAFTLTVTGTGFVSGAAVQWNGSNRTTTFVNSTTLTAAIPAGDIASAGTATIRVVNPDSSASGAKNLAITLVTAGVIERLSVSATGVESTQDSGVGSGGVITPDGRYVIFDSMANNLIAPDNTGGMQNLYLRDTCRGASTACVPSLLQITVAADGSAPNGHSYGGQYASVSATGRYVAFDSAATNLVANDTSTRNQWDVFVRDTCIGAPASCTPTTSLVSVASDGTQANGNSARPIMTADGRYIVFESYSNNLGGGTNGAAVYVRDTCAGATGCTPSTTFVINGYQASISAGARYVAVDTRVIDTCLGAAAGCVPSTAVPSDQYGSALGGWSPSISGDGRYIAYIGGGYPNYRAWVVDTCIGAPAGCTPARTYISDAPNGIAGNGTVLNAPWITPNGRFVVFQSNSTNLVAGTVRGNNVFVHDTCAGATGACTPATVQVSVGATGVQAVTNGILSHQSITDDGHFVVFASPDAFTPGDTNGKWDVFLATATSSAWPVAPVLDHLQLSPIAPSVVLGGQQQFTALGVMSDFTTTTLVSPLWQSSDQSVATIDSNGLATTKATGKTSISVSSGGKIAATSLVVTAPAPVISSLSPNSISAGSVGFTLTVNGTGFVSGAKVQWNGSNRITTFVNAGQLTTTINATDVASAASVNVTVVNPDSQISNQATFTVSQGAGVLEAASLATDGTLANASAESPVITPDGRFVLFYSKATNLVAGVTDGLQHIYLRDTCRGASGCTKSTILVDATSDGTPAAINTAYRPDAYHYLGNPISEDARYVVFSSYSTLLPRPSGAGSLDPSIYLRDTCIGAPAGCSPSTTLVSLANDGTTAWRLSYRDNFSLSGDGRFLTWTTDRNVASNYSQVYLRDLCTGATGCTPSTVLISATTSGGVAAAGADGGHSVSRDGRYVSFWSESAGLVGTMTYALLYVRDTCNGAPAGCTPATVNLLPDTYDHSWGTAIDNIISADGRFVGYDNVDYNVAHGLWIHDTCVGAAVACTPSDVNATTASYGAWSMSPDGRFIGYVAYIGNTNNMGAYVVDTCMGASGCTPSSRLVSKGQDGQQIVSTWMDVHGHSLSANGHFLAVMINDGTNDVVYVTLTGY